MKRYVFLMALFLPLQYGYAQKKPVTDYSSIITTKKVILKYQDQTDSLMIPLVSEKYPELKHALCDTNLFFGEPLDSVVQRYQGTGTGITAFNYYISYINNDVVSLKLYSETMGAYPDQQTQSLTLNIHNGKAYTLSKEINPAGLKWIYASYKQLLKKRIADDKSGIVAAKENKENSNEMDGYINKDENIDDIYGDLNQSVDDLTIEDLLGNYIFTDKGVVFTTEPRLAHAIRNFEPDRDWFIPYNKLNRYKLPGAIVLK